MTDFDRLKADASGHTALSERLAEAVDGFSCPQDALDFLAARGFAVTAGELKRAAHAEAARSDGPVGDKEGGFGALLRFMETAGEA